MDDISSRLTYIKSSLGKPVSMPDLDTVTIYKADVDWMIKTIRDLLQYQEHAQEAAKTIYKQNKRIQKLEIINQNLL